MKWHVLAIVAGLVLAGCGGSEEPNAAKAPKPGEGAGDETAKVSLASPSGVAPSTPAGVPAAAPAGGSALPRRADSTVREPAVAGLWYPPSPANLRKGVDGLLTVAVANVTAKVRAIIAPHAGYRYSGLTCAVAYKQLMGQEIETAIVLSPSHTARFQGASIPGFQAYRTPLGKIALSPKAAKLAKTSPFVPAAPVQVSRPPWWKQASKEAPAFGKDTPHTWEHALESHLPFLQRTLGSFKLVPVVYGDVDPAAVATALSGIVDDKTILVASTDLSHYHPYDEAKALDAWCLEAVREMNLKTMAQQEACGKGPVLTVMQIAKERGWKPRVLDYRTSGDIKNGDKSRVVGYMAAVFVEEGTVKSGPMTDAERRFLLALARKTVTSVVTRQPLPVVDRATLPAKLLAPKGCFVTLNKQEKLRGCVGYTLAVKPLYEAVMDMAIGAAVRDGRFKPVKPEELSAIEIDISILTVPKPIYYNTPTDLLATLRPNVDGVMLRVGKGNAVFLPLVWKQIPEPQKFMAALSVKAGLPANAWRQPNAKVLIFQAEEFKEAKE